MDLREIQNEVAKRLSTERYNHVVRVKDTAAKLGKRYGVCLKDVELAALLHDIAKNMSFESLRHRLETTTIDSRLLQFHHELWHAPVGMLIAIEDFGLNENMNLDILNAIRYHTTGRAYMSPLEKLIYIADMIEPGRDFPGIEKLRDLANQDLDQAMGACIQSSLQFLIAKGIAVFPDSVDCYNEHVQQKGRVKE